MKTLKLRAVQSLSVVLALILCLFMASPLAEPVSYEPSESFFIKNSRGYYSFVEVSLPVNRNKPCPIVFISHGFAGTIHSGGALELGALLAKKGIIAIRCDWNAFYKPSLTAERTGAYALRDMESDFFDVMKYAFSHYNVDPDRVGMYGRSYGGRLAMKVANENIGGFYPKALCLVAPAGDDICFRRFLGGEENYNRLKELAKSEGFAEYLGVKLYPEWFTDVESYVPSDEGAKFGDRPVLLFYNTLDRVVYPDTTKRCGGAYNNSVFEEITSEDGHGHEMGFDNSEIKDMIMNKIVSFFVENFEI